MTATRADVAVAVSTTTAAAAATLECDQDLQQILQAPSHRLTFLIHSIFQYFTKTRMHSIKILNQT
jgi:hypothetical protein